MHRVLVGFGGLFGGILADAFNAGNLCELVKKFCHIVADDDLELAGLGKAALDAGQCLDPFDVRLGRVRQNKPHARHAVGHGVDVLFAADQTQQLFGVRCKFSHGSRSFTIALVRVLTDKYINIYVYVCRLPV